MFYHQVKKSGGLPFSSSETVTNAATDDRTTRELNEDMQRLAECRAGQFIEHDPVDAWLRSIGTVDELPCPAK